MKQSVEKWEDAFEKAMKEKVYCGGDHCTEMWNLECDDINHNDGRELVIKWKVKSFIRSLLRQQQREALAKIRKEIE